MHITASSIYNAVFFSSMMIVFLWLLLKNWKVVSKLRFQLIFLCLALIVIRLLIPVEYFFTITVLSTNILPVVNDFLNYIVCSVAGHDIPMHHLLCIIWMTGSTVYLCKSLYTYLSLQKIIRHAKNIGNHAMLQNIISDIMNKHNSRKKIQIVQIPYLSTPMITGILHPCIFLPDIDLSEEELIFILNHETSHYFHGDLLMKFVMEILSVIYWWNPLMPLLKKQVSKVLEIHTDMRITKNLSELEQISYLECLVNTAKKRNKSYMEQLAIPFIGEHTTTLTQRVNIILNRQEVKKKEQFLASLSLFPLFIIALLSFCVIFEAYSISPENIENSVELTEDNAYLVPNADNEYDIYYNGEFWSTVSTTDALGIDLPVYYEHEKEDNINE